MKKNIRGKEKNLKKRYKESCIFSVILTPIAVFSSIGLILSIYDIIGFVAAANFISDLAVKMFFMTCFFVTTISSISGLVYETQLQQELEKQEKEERKEHNKEAKKSLTNSESYSYKKEQNLDKIDVTTYSIYPKIKVKQMHMKHHH